MSLDKFEDVQVEKRKSESVPVYEDGNVHQIQCKEDASFIFYIF